MNSAVLPSFWKAYEKLDQEVKRRAQKAFHLWVENPFHPSLHFKCINVQENIWSVRISLGYRALGIWEGDTVTWFWIGNHDDYQRYFG
jgi:mRNA-degrading endonuclease RelE of RelBE toxin-antitoxin system